MKVWALIFRAMSFLMLAILIEMVSRPDPHIFLDSVRAAIGGLTLAIVAGATWEIANGIAREQTEVKAAQPKEKP